MFDCPAKVGLKTIGLPDEELDNMQTEDLERLCNHISNDINEICGEEPNAVDINETEEEKEELGETNVLVAELENQEERVPPMSSALAKRKHCIIKKRHQGFSGLENQPKKMKNNSDHKLPKVNVGETVRISIPDVDRTRGDLRNIIGIILSVQYKLFQEKLMVSEDVPNNDISLRECARKWSNMGGQRYDRCFW
ncbi:hypothetical protein QE152_g8306 [Popillia japonica]|uniref:Uncharacterized protein n=1 Tax=Popillia japonica TaxID=7064 RepID=A0AAW1MD35_POPJA